MNPYPFSSDGRRVSSAPKGHHVVAKMLLRRFSANGHVTLVARDDFARTHTCNIDNALKINNFYTIERIDGSTSTEVENPGFSSLEGGAADAIRQVVDAGRFPPTPRVREVMSLFLAYQLMRGEGAREAIIGHRVAIAERVLKLGLEMARQATMNDGPIDENVRDLLESIRVDFEKKHGRAPTPEEVRAELREMARLDVKWSIDKPSNAHIEAFSAIPEIVSKYLAQRSWQLVYFEAPSLLTGDEPVALVADHPHQLGHPLGVKTAAEIVFPLDPSHALVMVRPDRYELETRVMGSPESARIINRTVAYRCYRWIVHHPEHTPLNGLTVPKQGKRVSTQGPYVAVHLSPVSATYAPRPPRKKRRN